MVTVYPASESAPQAPLSGVRGLIFDVMRFSLHDGPGIRTTVFFKGCPLKCWWCHNPEGLSRAPEVVYIEARCVRCGDCVTACPHHAISWSDRPIRDSEICQLCASCAAICPSGATQVIGRWVSVDQIMQEIEKDAIFFDQSGGGVTFSGGEPLLQPEFLEAVLTACQNRRIHTVVETSGAAATKTLLRISAKVGLFLYDLKLMDSRKHREYTGAGNERILANLKALVEVRRNIIVRVPIIPGINDDLENSAELTRFLKSAGVSRLDLLPYHEIGTDKYERLHRRYRLPGLKAPSDEQMRTLAQRFQKDGLTVRVGG